MKITYKKWNLKFFWDTSHGPIESYQHYAGTCCLYLLGRRMNLLQQVHHNISYHTT